MALGKEKTKCNITDISTLNLFVAQISALSEFGAFSETQISGNT